MGEEINIKLSDEDVEDAKGRLRWARVEEVVFEHRWKILFVLFGTLFLGVSIFLFRAGVFEGTKIEVIDSGYGASKDADPLRQDAGSQVIVEISGAVEKPGVYKLLASERLERLLIEAGGLAADADREWVEKNLNRAAKLIDGQKIYIPSRQELGIRNQELGRKSTDSVLGAFSGLVNINTATLAELDSLPGIGAVRAQAIIDSRPYSSPNELLSKKIIPQSVYEKIKDKITAP